jgi:hypothetical protein
MSEQEAEELCKQEQKKPLIEIMQEDEDLGLYAELKQETLEEAARKYANITHNRPLDEEERYYKDYQKHDGFIEGAKWQQERSYSEEEVLKLWHWLNDGFIIRKSLPTREELIGYFEQFKKK